MTVLRLEGVGKRFGDQTALADIDLTVEGGRTAIVGRSGSGKTTLLRIVAGFERPDRGRVTLDGTVLADDTAFVPAHRRGIGYVSQDGALFPHLSVADNIGFGLAPRTPDRAARVAGLLDMVELDRALLARRPHQLSGGQQQRVALARALARAPRLMLLDEPFSALDPGLRESLREAVSRLLSEAGIAAILVTHDREEALSYADRLAVLDGGRLAQVGPPREVYLRPRDRETALLVGEALLVPAILGDGVATCMLGSFPVAPGRPGPAEIMLRHEQIRLRPLRTNDSHGDVDPSQRLSFRGRAAEPDPKGAGGETHDQAPRPVVGSGFSPAASPGMTGVVINGSAALEVLEVEFRGATCVVVLAPPGAPPLRVTVPAPEAPEPGARVQVEVVGPVHALAAPLTSRP